MTMYELFKLFFPCNYKKKKCSIPGSSLACEHDLSKEDRAAIITNTC